jgi:hypothetical protein
MISLFCLYVCASPLINFCMPEPIFRKLGTYMMAPEPISTEYLKTPFHQSVCLYVHPPIVYRQRLGKGVPAATNTHATVVELLGTSLSMRSVSYQRKIGD